MLNNSNLLTRFLIKYLSINSSVSSWQLLRYSSKGNDYYEQIKQCCQILNISNIDFTAADLKNAYIESCKRTHPDLNNQDDKEFLLIEAAYHKLKQYLENKVTTSQTQNQSNIIEEQEEDSDRIRHKVPQHRQYLNYDGVGFGTPSDRLKQYQKHRLTRATDSVNEFQLNKIMSKGDWSQNDSLILRDPNLQRQVKVKHGFDRLVEDLIQESMARGDFENLPGSGKPLKYRPEVPYLDSTTFKLNEILINNGFVPEWVLLEKEIRNERNSIRKELLSLKATEKLSDSKLIEQIETRVKELNHKINKYNTVVPIIAKQQIHFILKNEMNKIKETACDNNHSNKENSNSKFDKNENKINSDRTKILKNSDNSQESRDNLLKRIMSLFS